MVYPVLRILMQQLSPEESFLRRVELLQYLGAVLSLLTAIGLILFYQFVFAQLEAEFIKSDRGIMILAIQKATLISAIIQQSVHICLQLWAASLIRKRIKYGIVMNLAAINLVAGIHGIATFLYWIIQGCKPEIKAKFH